MSQNHYQVLGVAADAPAAEIKRAYRRLVVRFHPDKHGGDTRFEDQFKAVAVAYGVLSDPARRASYDFQLAQAARRAEELRRQQFQHQHHRPAGQHVYGVPVPPPGAPLRTRPPAGRRERHYVPRPQVRFNRHDWLLTLAVFVGLMTFGFGTNAVLDRISTSRAYDAGLQAYARHSWVEAYGFMEEALSFRSDYAPALRRRAELSLLDHRHPAEVRADVLAALLEPQPRRAEAALRYRLGRAEMALGRPQLAEQHFSRALQLDAGLALAYLARGRNRLYYLGQPQAAVADFDQGLGRYQQQHRRPPSRYVQARGVALAALGRFEEARADYLRVLLNNPQDGRTHFLLGCLAQQTGDQAAACEFMRRAVALGYSYAEQEWQSRCDAP